ncbi:MAG TPA: ATP-binding protein [Micromonosporaceae bacterium]
MNPQWTLRRRVTALCLLVGAVLTFLASGATMTAAANRGQLDNLIDAIGPMRTASTALLAALVSQEAGVRGYVVSGAEADLEPYRVGLTGEAKHTAFIAGSTAANAEIRADLAVVTERARQWRANVAEPVIAAVRAGDRTAAEAMLGESARARFEGIRAAVADLEQGMLTVRDEAIATIKGTSSTLLFVLIVAVLLVIAGGIGLVVAMQRAVIGPVTDLAAQVRSVARGNYSMAISTIGPPELRNLAFDIDSMRQQIASDLAEVQAARRQIEEANLLLEQQAGELTRSNRDLEQFAYVASHDLQEPLRKVASFCQLLQRRYQGQLDERADQYIAFAVNGAQRMQRLINDLLAFSRIGRSTSGFTDVDLDRVVADVAAQADAAQDQDGARIIWSDLPVVRGEEALLATLFGNLIGNALKFRRPDQPAQVRISARRAGDEWELSCIDNGIGIEQEFSEKVFVIFQRLHPRDAYPGTGIGLAIAKKIVEYHGGRIWLDSDYTDGTAIRFTLPVWIEPTQGMISAAIHSGSAERITAQPPAESTQTARQKEAIP